MTAEKFYIIAEQTEQEVRDAGLAKAREALSGQGSEECEDCGVLIHLARRQALPSATRCIDCQEQHERL